MLRLTAIGSMSEIVPMTSKCTEFWKSRSVRELRNYISKIPESPDRIILSEPFQLTESLACMGNESVIT